MARKVGFIGLGIMGRGMAANLIKAGYDVTLWNRTRSKAEELAALGAKVADSPIEAARGSEVVMTMLADPAAVQSILLGPEGAVEGLGNGCVLIDSSTNDPETTRLTAEAAASKGAAYLDAPVTGSKDGAERGELLMLVGGDKEVLDRVRDVLDVVGRKTIHAGPTGSGTRLKLCFNLMVAHTLAGLTESFVLGAKSGIKPELVLDTLMSAPIGSPYIQWKGNCMLDRDFATHFSTKLMHKDLNLIMGAGYDFGVPLPVTAAVKELFGMAKGHGEGEDDMSSVVKIIEETAGIEVRR